MLAPKVHQATRQGQREVGVEAGMRSSYELIKVRHFHARKEKDGANALFIGWTRHVSPENLESLATC